MNETSNGFRLVCFGKSALFLPQVAETSVSFNVWLSSRKKDGFTSYFHFHLFLMGENTDMDAFLFMTPT